MCTIHSVFEQTSHERMGCFKSVAKVLLTYYIYCGGGDWPHKIFKLCWTFPIWVGRSNFVKDLAVKLSTSVHYLGSSAPIGNVKLLNWICKITDLFKSFSDIDIQTFLFYFYLFYFILNNDFGMDQELKSALHLSFRCLVLHVYSAKWLTISRIETKA